MRFTQKIAFRGICKFEISKISFFFLADSPKTYQSWDEKQRINMEQPKLFFSLVQMYMTVRIRSTKTCITFCFQVQLSHLSLEAKRTVRLLDLHKKSFVQRQAIKQRQLRSMGITSLSIIPDDIAEAHAKVNCVQF